MVKLMISSKPGMEAVRAKSIEQTEYLIPPCEPVLPPLVSRLSSPRDVQQCGSHISLLHADGEVIAGTRHARRILETNHPPVYYIPGEDIKTEYLEQARHHSYCEWKGEASYYTMRVVDRTEQNAAWFYPDPTPSFISIQNYVAFYPSKMDECLVDGERMQAQPDDYYGGWITSNIVGLFKGSPRTWRW